MTKGKGNVAKSGNTVFSWHKIPFNHMSLAVDRADFLVYKGIVVATFPFKFSREKMYAFLDRHWDRIGIFLKYIDSKVDDE